MTIIEAVANIDAFKPNNYTYDEKRAWLLRLDSMVQTEIIETHENNNLFGDANGDGKVSVEDADLIRDYAAGSVDESAINLENADVNGDGTVNAVDAGLIRKTLEEEKLLVPAPYDEVYIRWLEAQIDYANGEYGRYNNSMTMFNASYSAFRNYWNRTHMPKGKRYKFF